MRLLRVFLPVLLVLGGAVGAQKLTTPVVRVTTDTLRAPLSVYQKATLMEFDRQIKLLSDQRNLYLAAVVSAIVDPGKIGDWQVVVGDSAVFLIPPKKP